jgi:putative ABC transport system permease protein
MPDMAFSDLRLAFRMLRRSPGFAATAVLTLGLGVGVNTAMFTIIDALMLRPLPFEAPDRLALIYTTDNRRANELTGNLNLRKLLANTELVERWSQLSRSFESIGGYRMWRLSATGQGTPERLDGAVVSGEFFRVLGVKPALGRGFTRDELRPDGSRVVILSHAYWARRFGTDPGVLGRKVVFDGDPYTIVGVMPARFMPTLPRIASHPDVWTTPVVDFTSFILGGARRPSVCQAIGRLKPGVSLEQAQAEMEAVARHLGEEDSRFQRWGIQLARAGDELADNLRLALLVLFGAVAAILLIACANIAGLGLARQAARRRETAIRAALGASKWQISAEAIAESAIVSCAGGILGLVLATWILKALPLVSPVQFQGIADMAVDARVLLFTFLVSALAATLSGLLPGLAAARGALVPAMARVVAGRNTLAARYVLVVAEVALAVVLLSGAGLLLRSFILLRGVETGFDAAHLIAAELPVPKARYDAPAARQALTDTLTERLSRLPGIEAVGMTNSMALAGTFMLSSDFSIEGRPEAKPDPQANVVGATSGYYRATGMLLVAGRVYTDAEAGRGVAMINEAAAKRHFPAGDAVGHRIRVMGCRSCEITGVVRNIRNFGLKAEPVPEIYIPLAYSPAPVLGLALHTRGDPGPLVPSIRAELAQAAPDMPLDRIRTMADVVASHTSQDRFNAMVLSAFAGLAVLLAAIGVFAVTAYSVAQRTPEIGVRMVLGALPHEVLGMVLRRALALGLAGACLGAAGALVVARALRSLLFEVKPNDPATLAAVGLLAIVLVLAAAWLPARRAASISPIDAIRDQ